MTTAALALADQVAAKSLREGLFLSTFTALDLPKAMLGAAMAAIPATLLLSFPMRRLGPARLAPALFVISALLHAAEWALLPRAPRAAAVVVFLHVSTFGAILTSTFWSIVNERFDPRVLKRLVGKIGASATLGGLLGGAAMERMARWVDARSALLVVGAMCLATAYGAFLLSRTFVDAAPEPEARRSTAFTGYLWTLALIVACSAAMSTFADFALKQIAAARFESAESLVRFFAMFYTSSAVLGFLLQVLLSRRLLDTIGIAGTLTIPPFLGIGLSVLSLAAPSLGTVGALRGADMALGSSLFRSAFEPLFTPLSPAAKRGAKAFIDVAFDKGGDAAASAVILVAAATAPAMSQRLPLVLATVAAALTLLLSFRARRGYVTELEASLRGGTLNLDATDVDDATTKMTLSVTAFGIDRTKLLEQIARLRQTGGLDTSEAGRTAVDSGENEALVAEVRVLLGSDVSAITAVLTRPGLDPRLAAFVLPHLGRSHVSKHAVTALRGMGDAIVGLLSDAMLSPRQPVVVRRRIPYVLRALRGEPVSRALAVALSSDILEVRYRAALALRDVTEDEQELRPPRRQIYSMALREVESGNPTTAVVDHVFALLSLCTPRQSVELVRQGLASDNKKLRGIALEYLETLLPDAIRLELVARLDPGAAPRKDLTRTHDQLWTELKSSLKNEPPSKRKVDEDDHLDALDTMPPEEKR